MRTVDNGVDEGDDFYEEDEPVEEIRAAFEQGEKVKTRRPPRDLNSLAKSIVDRSTGAELTSVYETENGIKVGPVDNIVFRGFRVDSGGLEIEPAKSNITIA